MTVKLKLKKMYGEDKKTKNTNNQSTSIYTQWTGCLSLPNWS